MEEVNDHAPGLDKPPVQQYSGTLPGDASMIGRLVPVYLQESKGLYYMGHIADRKMNRTRQTITGKLR